MIDPEENTEATEKDLGKPVALPFASGLEKGFILYHRLSINRYYHQFYVSFRLQQRNNPDQ